LGGFFFFADGLLLEGDSNGDDFFSSLFHTSSPDMQISLVCIKLQISFSLNNKQYIY